MTKEAPVWFLDPRMRHDGASSRFTACFPEQELEDDGAPVSIFPSQPKMLERALIIQRGNDGCLR